ncbi:MAG: hypothetical protein KDA68_21175, partial [Planctomycetaceae bacterium]|nr:hypothetical protein [Planctomycetaceae bacterium]
QQSTGGPAKGRVAKQQEAAPCVTNLNKPLPEKTNICINQSPPDMLLKSIHTRTLPPHAQPCPLHP